MTNKSYIRYRKKSNTMKYILTLFTAFMVLGATAQVPSYVPTDSLVGYWPFNENANDESGNGNHGTVNGSTLTTDRDGNANAAYDFDGNDYIEMTSNASLNVGSGSFTLSCWAVKTGGHTFQHLVTKNYITTWPDSKVSYWLRYAFSGLAVQGSVDQNTSTSNGGCELTTLNNANQWNHITGVFDSSTKDYFIYVNGVLVATYNFTGIVYSQDNSGSLYFGVEHPTVSLPSGPQYLTGQLDDVGIWNRALDPTEVTALYMSKACSDTLLNDTTEYYVSNVQFQALSPRYEFIQTDSLSTNTGGCDSVVNQYAKYVFDSTHCTDTVSISVTDTLVIDVLITAIPAPNNVNTLKVYPNPTNDIIYIDNGDYSMMNGYTITILNSGGQPVFNSLINAPTFTVNISQFAMGTYYLQILDNNSNIVEVRHIVLQ